MTDDLREQTAKWLFMNSHRLSNQRFYHNWYDEIKVSPLTEREYRNLANEILALIDPHFPQLASEKDIGYSLANLKLQRDDTFKKTVKGVYEWIWEWCPHTNADQTPRYKHDCNLCQAELLKKVEG